MNGLFKCSNKKIKKLIKDLKEDTEMLDLSKIQLINKIRKLTESNRRLRKRIKKSDNFKFSRYNMN